MTFLDDRFTGFRPQAGTPEARTAAPERNETYQDSSDKVNLPEEVHAEALEAELLVRRRVGVEKASPLGLPGGDDQRDDDEECAEGVHRRPDADTDLPGRVGDDRVDDVRAGLQGESVRTSMEAREGRDCYSPSSL